MIKKKLTMSNESSENKIIWNILYDIGMATTDESILKGKTFIKVVRYKDGSIKALGVEPKEREKEAMRELKQYNIDMIGDMFDVVGGKKSSDGNKYYKIVM